MEAQNMKAKWLFMFVLMLVIGLASSYARAQLFPNDPTWTTLLRSGQTIGPPGPLATAGTMEGLTGDNAGNFYVADRGLDDGNHDDTCHVWRINPGASAVNLVGRITANPCRPSGIALGPDGQLYITTSEGGGIIYRLTPNATAPFSASANGSIYATGVPGANGVAFLGSDLFVTDGTANRGIVWKIATCATPPCPAVEFLRVPPMRNVTTLGGNVSPNPPDRPAGVGSVRYTVPRHDPNAPSTSDRQDIVANGVAFSADGRKIFIADTARGAIWAADLTNTGELEPDQTGCDPTYHEDALCTDRLHVAHPLLEGIDGFVLLTDGTILAAVNERNAIVAVSPEKQVTDAFRNTADETTFLRNGNGTQQRPLEFPTSPFVSGTTFCATHTDTPRRDNNPSGPGESSKVNCLNQPLTTSELALPVQ